MAKQKGSLKTGGRQKGTPNKKSLQLNEALELLDYNVTSKLIEAIELLDPKDKSNALLQFMQYVYPKRKPLDELKSNDLNENLNAKNHADINPSVSLTLEEEIKIYEAVIRSKKLRLASAI